MAIKNLFDPVLSAKLKYNYEKARNILTESKIEEILHYTDIKANPFYTAYKSPCIYDLTAGAKGTSKTFTRGILEALISLIKDPNENPFVCRNFYKHIQTTIKPACIQAFQILKEKHEIDLIDNFVILREQIDFYNGISSIPQSIYFGNGENIQAIQGFTLPSPNFYISQLIIDEPIEDPKLSGTKQDKLEQIYEIQESSLSLLLDNTIFRKKLPDGVRPKCKFFYNPFDPNHWLIKNFQSAVAPFNEDLYDELVENRFYQAQDKDFGYGLGIIFTCLSREFPPAVTISDTQRAKGNELKEKDYRMGMVTVMGVAFLEGDNLSKFYLRKFIYNADGEYKHDWTYHGDVTQDIKDGKIIALCSGLDVGVVDATAMARVAVDTEGNLIVVNLIPEILKKEIKKNKRIVVEANNNQAIAIMRTGDDELDIAKIDDNNREIRATSEFAEDYRPILLTDNMHCIQALKIIANNQNYPLDSYMAVRKDGRNQDTGFIEYFGIENRQKFWIDLFENQKIKFCLGTEFGIDLLAQQVILDGETKRDETINKSIYDVINALENACSGVYRIRQEQENMNNQ